MQETLLLLAAGVVAGAMNAASGGGSFVSLPALTFVGVPALLANTSSTVSLFPGSLASVWAYRRELGPVADTPVRSMMLMSLIGGLFGALLLLSTPSRAFDRALPWLLLFATVAFAFGKQLGARLRAHARVPPAGMLAVQLVLGVYGGYFGGGVGIMMMAVWSVFGADDLRTMNATRTLLVGATNAVAVLCFIAVSKVVWPQAVCVLAGAVLGGYFGARITRRIDPKVLRIGISLFNVAMTAVFFARAYG